MPLTKSGSKAAFKSNLKAEIAAGKPKSQSLAIAYRIQREHMADGGGVGSTPFYARSAARNLERSGMINSAVAGRTDRHPMGLKPGSYVLPADIVSGLGQGNSMSGANALNRLFKTGPYGAESPRMKMPSGGMIRGRRGFADGGAAESEEEPVDVVTAGGEFIVSPDVVAELGGGDMERGHEILDQMVKQIRAKTIKTMRRLPGPKQS